MNKNEVGLSILLDMYVYLDIQDARYDGMSMAEIFECPIFIRRAGTSYPNYYNTLKDAVTPGSETYNKDFARTELINQSMIDSPIDRSLLVACSFALDGTYIVAYRGTGDGKWVDNAVGMYEKESQMQRAAADYFDYVVGELRLDRTRPRIVVTGHSKGGNSAQFVTLASRHADLISACYSFNGQGFSESAIRMFEQNPNFQARLNRMFSINAENDYVHVLGIPVIPSSRTYYVSNNATDFKGMHDINAMIDGVTDFVNKGTLAEQGAFSKYFQRLSEEMMKMNERDLKNSSLAIMSLLEMFMGDEANDINSMFGTGDVKFANFENFVGFIAVGLPLILKTATTPEGRALIGHLIMETINGIAQSENGGWKLAGLAALLIICAPAIVLIGAAVLKLGAVIWLGAVVINCILGLFDGKLTISDVAAMALAVIAPHLVIAVLAVIAVISLVTYIIGNWDNIMEFAKSMKDKVVVAATALLAWVEHLKINGLDIIKNAVQKAASMYQSAAQAITKFGSDLLKSAGNFFKNVGRNVTNAFKKVSTSLSNIFGSATLALSASGTIDVTISRVDDMQRRLNTLRSRYLDTRTATNNMRTVVSRVSSHYNRPGESYVRNCCRDIENALKNAQTAIDAAERNLDKRRRALVTAVSTYRTSDQSARNKIRSGARSLA